MFCKIIKGENKSMKVFEDEFTYSFMDVAGDVYGHILVVPKNHIKNIFDCGNITLSYVMDTVKKVSNHLIDNCSYEDVSFLNASGECAGQSVQHFHIHIITKKK